MTIGVGGMGEVYRARRVSTTTASSTSSSRRHDYAYDYVHASGQLYLVEGLH
jgi:hypothetical protein